MFHVFKPYPRFSDITVEGGGTKGIYYPGVLKALDEFGVTDQVKVYRGTSIGSLIAALAALGFSNEQISEISRNADLNDLKGAKAKTWTEKVLLAIGEQLSPSLTYVDKVIKILRDPKRGLWTGKPFERMIEKTFAQHFQDDLPTLRVMFGDDFDPRDITFEQLHELVVSQNPNDIPKKYKDLEITGTNLNKASAVIFGWSTHPKMKIRDAIRISTAFPGAFAAVPLSRETGERVDDDYAYAHPKEVDWYVDGGLLMNDPRPSINDYNEFTLGLRVDSPEEQLQTFGLSVNADGFLSGLKPFLEAATSDLQVIKDNPLSTVQIITDMGTFDETTPQQREQKMQDGYRQTQQWLENYYVDAIYDRQSYQTIAELYANEPDDLFRYIALYNRYMELKLKDSLTTSEEQEKQQCFQAIGGLIIAYQKGDRNLLTERYQKFINSQEEKIKRHEALFLKQFQTLPMSKVKPVINISESEEVVKEHVDSLNAMTKYVADRAHGNLDILANFAKDLVRIDHYINSLKLLCREQNELAHITGNKDEIEQYKQRMQELESTQAKVHATLSTIANNKDYAAKEFLMNLECYIKVKEPPPGYFQIIPKYMKNSSGEMVRTAGDVHSILNTIKLAKAGKITWPQGEAKVMQIGRNAEKWNHSWFSFQRSATKKFYTLFKPEKATEKASIYQEVEHFREACHSPRITVGGP